MKKTLSVLFFIVLFFMIQLHAPRKVFSAVLLDRIVATVNDEVVTWSELMNVIIMEGRQALEGRTGKEREERIKEMERPFLNNLIEIRLQLQEARRMQLEVNETEIEGAINEIKTKYNLTEEALMKSLSAEGLSREDYRESLADQILLQKVINFTVRDNIIISDTEIDQYYKDNRDKFDTEEKFRIRQIFFALPEDSSQRGALDLRAQELAARIKGGEDFGVIANEVSEDSGSESGGDLGYISRGNVLKEIEDVAAALAEGEVSKPFWSPAGLHIIKLEEKIAGGGIDKVRDEIRETLQQKAFEKKYREWAAGLREKAHIEIKL